MLSVHLAYTIILKHALRLYQKFHHRTIVTWTKICSRIFKYYREVQVMVILWLVTEG